MNDNAATSEIELNDISHKFEDDDIDEMEEQDTFDTHDVLGVDSPFKPSTTKSLKHKMTMGGRFGKPLGFKIADIRQELMQSTTDVEERKELSKLIDSMDTDGDGTITVWEIISEARNMKREHEKNTFYKRIIAFAVLMFFLACMLLCGIVVVGIELTKEVRASSGNTIESRKGSAMASASTKTTASRRLSGLGRSLNAGGSAFTPTTETNTVPSQGECIATGECIHCSQHEDYSPAFECDSGDFWVTSYGCSEDAVCYYDDTFTYDFMNLTPESIAQLQDPNIAVSGLNHHTITTNPNFQIKATACLPNNILNKVISIRLTKVHNPLESFVPGSNSAMHMNEDMNFNGNASAAAAANSGTATDGTDDAPTSETTGVACSYTNPCSTGYMCSPLTNYCEFDDQYVPMDETYAAMGPIPIYLPVTGVAVGKLFHSVPEL